MESAADRKFIVSVSPHITSGRTTRGIMLDVVIALTPAAVMAGVLFGLDALFVITTCIAVSVLTEYLFNVLCKRSNTIGDVSAVVTGLLLAMNLPSTIPLWQAAVGSVFAIGVVKCLFGGLGKNFANPAVTARVMMLIAFTETMSATPPLVGVDSVATATPLAIIGGAQGTLPMLSDMLLGLRSGALGETCAIALLAGGIYLLVRRVITWHAPVIFIGSVFLLSCLLYGGVEAALYQALSGGLLLGAIFMATDYVTTPTTAWGKVIFALGCGLLTVVIRRWGAYPEGVSFSILIMNIVSPYIEKATMRKPLGEVKA